MAPQHLIFLMGSIFSWLPEAKDRSSLGLLVHAPRHAHRLSTLTRSSVSLRLSQPLAPTDRRWVHTAALRHTTLTIPAPGLAFPNLPVSLCSVPAFLAWLA